MLLALLSAAALASGLPFLNAEEVESPCALQASRAAVAFAGGSGFVISEEGLVVTAWHVARRVGDRPWVLRGWTGEEAPAPERLVRVAADPDADLALYRLREGRYPAVPLREDAAKAGEPILAMAHPPERAVAFSHGAVLEPPARWLGQPVLEYDAPAYDGYSGGAVLDEQCRAVGVHRGWDPRGYGHGALVAVPASQLRALVASLEPSEGASSEPR